MAVFVHEYLDKLSPQDNVNDRMFYLGLSHFGGSGLGGAQSDVLF